jgi:cell division protein FtsW
MNVRLKIFDPALFVLALIATAIGLLAIFDAGYARSLSESHGWIPPEFRSQLMWLPVALLAAYGCASLRPSAWRTLSKGSWFVVLGLLLLVRFHGEIQNHAKRWIGFGKVGIEPSEFAKIAVVLYLAAVFANWKAWPKKIPPRKDSIQALETIWWQKHNPTTPAWLVLAAVTLISLQPDLGTAAVIAVTAFAMCVVGGVSRKSLVVGVLVALVGTGILVVKEPYRLDRIVHHAQRWDPKNVDETEYQTAQSELAQADGGLLGVGPGGGRAKHILPATTTDFVMATVGEESGLVGSLVVLAALGGVVWRILYLSGKAEDRFSRMVLFGIGSWLAIQTCVNIMMANAFLPAIGIPLPFVSSGGSSLIALWMAIGICQATQMPAQVAVKEGVKVATRSNRWWNRRTHLSRA